MTSIATTLVVSPNAKELVPVERPRHLSDAVVQVLESRIRSRQLAPGEKLPTERELAETLGVSRTVVREGLARLKADGYILTRQGSGVFVSDRPGQASFRVLQDGGTGAEASGDDLRHLFELRLIVEAAAAELAARRRTPDDLRALKAASARLVRALETGIEGAEADEAFHRAVAAATHNPYIRRFIEFLGRSFNETRRPSWTEEGRAAGKAAAAQREHEQIVDAIQGRSPREARAAALAHLRNSATRTGIDSSSRRRTTRRSQ
jgi:GntR family transcriptional repressor for pyruvate dehydrogenase complex